MDGLLVGQLPRKIFFFLFWLRNPQGLVVQKYLTLPRANKSSIAFNNIYSIKNFHLVKVKSLSHVQLFATPWTVAYQAPQATVHGVFRQEYWSVLPFPSPEDLPDPGIKPESPALQADI